LVGEVLDRHQRGKRAARPFDAKLAVRLRLGARERPAKAGLGGEEPHQRRGDAKEERRQQAKRGPDDVARSQKPYPTEKCSRQALSRAPYARSARIGPIGVRKRTPAP